jgi:hypothetical protein
VVAAVLAAEGVEACTTHGACGSGEYCDSNHNCYDCSYTFRNRCDAFNFHNGGNPRACTDVCGTSDVSHSYTFSGLEMYRGDRGAYGHLNGVYTRTSDSCNGQPGERRCPPGVCARSAGSVCSRIHGGSLQCTSTPVAGTTRFSNLLVDAG